MQRHAVACSTPTTEQTQAASGFAQSQQRHGDSWRDSFRRQAITRCRPQASRQWLSATRMRASAVRAGNGGIVHARACR
jgi:hypothetical protein